MSNLHTSPITAVPMSEQHDTYYVTKRVRMTAPNLVYEVDQVIAEGLTLGQISERYGNRSDVRYWLEEAPTSHGA